MELEIGIMHDLKRITYLRYSTPSIFKVTLSVKIKTTCMITRIRLTEPGREIDTSCPR